MGWPRERGRAVLGEVAPVNPAGGIAPAAPAPRGGAPAAPAAVPVRSSPSAAVETTGLRAPGPGRAGAGPRRRPGCALARLPAQRLRWYGSTQDTVVGLQALTRYAAGRRPTSTPHSSSLGQLAQRPARLPQNADVMQMIDVPVGAAWRWKRR